MLDDDDLQDRIDRFDDLLNRRASPTSTDEADLPALLLAGHLEDFAPSIDPIARRHIAASVETYLNDFVAQEQAGDPAMVGPYMPAAIQRVEVGRAPSRRITPLSTHGGDVARRRRLFWQTFVAAAILVALVNVAAALLPLVPPTSPFYVFREIQENVETVLAPGPTSRAQSQIVIAQNALSQFEGALQQNDGAAYQSFFNTFVNNLNSADQAVQAIPAGSDRNALAANVETLREQAENALHQALHHADWSNRLQATNALKALGASVPSIQSVNVSHSSGKPGNGKTGGGATGNGGQGNGSSGNIGASKSVVIHVHGSGFVNGAILYINGTVMGAIISVMPHDIEATLSGVSTLRAGTIIGVSNPDYTLAQFTLVAQVSQAPPSSQIATETPPEATTPPGTGYASPIVIHNGIHNGNGNSSGRDGKVL